MAKTIDLLALLGWMEETEALQFLQEGCTEPEPPSEAQARRIWTEFRHRTTAAALAGDYRPPPYQLDESAAGVEFMASAGGSVKAVIAVNPAELIPFQLFVAAERASAHAGAPGTWAQRCLPTSRARAAL